MGLETAFDLILSSRQVTPDYVRGLVDAVMAKMRELPMNDFMTRDGALRADGRPAGRLLRHMHLFEVKKPGDSRGPWDLYRLVATVPGTEAFRPVEAGGCPLVAKATTK